MDNRNSSRNKGLIEKEKSGFSFFSNHSRRAVTLRPLFNPHDTFEPLFKKTQKDAGFAPEVSRVMNEKINEYLTAPVERLFIVEA